MSRVYLGRKDAAFAHGLRKLQHGPRHSWRERNDRADALTAAVKA